jgi:hypothetical protein
VTLRFSHTSFTQPRGAGFALVVFVVVLLVGVVPAAVRPQAAAATPHIMMYRGLGTWVDMYDARAWDDPAAAAQDMLSHGVRTLYLETSNYHWSTAINRPAAVNGLIRECHARDIKVVAWYLPGFTKPSLDYARSMAAVRYRTPDGQKFDSFALDIEASLVKSISTRNSRLKTLSAKIREAVGKDYPLGAIIPSPAGMAKNATYWPRFPYKAVAAVYNVIVPMGYYTYHGDGYANAYNDTRANVLIIRTQTGRASIPIHVIAGDAAKSSASETLAYVRALRETGCIGGSMYDWATTSAASWSALVNVRLNPTQRPALPLAVGYVRALGNLPVERTHPKEVFYRAAAQSGDRVLGYQLYDAQAGEVRLIVNWKTVAVLPAGPSKAWTKVRSIPVPAVFWNATGANVIGFVAKGEFGAWSVWGVRGVTLAGP